MEKDFFTSAFPSPDIHMEQSLGINLLTNIQLTDYYLNGSHHATEWLATHTRQLPESFTEALHYLRPIFAHGVILRQFYMEERDDLNEGWEPFINWWKDMPEERIRDLVIYGINENMDYYYRFLPSAPMVEETMQDVSLDEGALQDPANRQRAIQAVLQSWNVANIEDTLAFYDDLARVRENIIHLLETYWFSGFQAFWQTESKHLAEWQEQNGHLLSAAYRTNDEALLDVTGSSPDTDEMEHIQRAESMTFVPVLNLDRLFVFFSVGRNLYVMFEPPADKTPASTERADVMAASPAFEGLGDQTRLQIIDLLAANREMFAQQIVIALDLKQSTVSRHLNQLDKSGLVSARRVGNTKYFSINTEAIEHVIHVLQSFVK